MDQKLYAGSFSGQPPIVVGPEGRTVGIHHNVKMDAWLSARSERFVRMTQGRGAPMAYGGSKKS